MNDNQLIFEAYLQENKVQPVMTTDDQGNQFWSIENGKKWHREDGPAAILANGRVRAWYVDGACTREDGPAIEHHDGTKYWYLDHKEFKTPELWAAAVLRKQHKPDDDKYVEEFLRPILAKQTKDLI